MGTPAFMFRFEEDVDVLQAELVLHEAIRVAEGLFGEARVRTDVTYRLDEPGRAAFVDGSTPAGDAVALVFTQALGDRFGPDSFKVRRVQGEIAGGRSPICPQSAPAGGASR